MTPAAPVEGVDPESRRRFLTGSGRAARDGGGGRSRRALAGRSTGRLGGPGRDPAARAGRPRAGRAGGRGSVAGPARAVRHPERRVLPDRHRAGGAAGRPGRPGGCASTAWSQPSARYSYADLLARPLVERVRHPDLRLQRGRRGPDRQRPLARACRSRTCSTRPAPDAAPTRSSAGRSTAGPRHAHRRALARRPRRAARRRHERRAAAGRARLPGPDGRARPLRLRVGHQVGDRARADHASPTSTPTGCRAAGRRRGRSRPQSRIDTPAAA